MKLKKEHFLFGLALLTLGVTSCKKDDVVFNQDIYNNLVKASFPVKDVDRNQTWAAMESAQVNVKTYGRFANGCAIKIYAENPIVVDKPTLLAQTAAMSGVDTRTFSTSISYMVGQGMIYVTVIDAQGYMTVVPKSVSPNETVSVEIGEPTTVASRHRVLTVADQIPTIAYSTMEAMRSTLLQGAEELTQAYADNDGNTAPLRLKISSGTWNYTCRCLGDERGRTLYIGKNVTWNIPAGAEVHVGRNGVIFLDEGAKINLGSGAKLISDMKGQIVCMKNSEINDTNDNGEVNIANGTAGDKIIYNAGTIKVGTFDNNGGYFYNANKVITNFYQSSSFNGQNVNRGSIQVNGNANMVNSALFNACKFVCTGELTVAYIVNGNGAYIACGSYLPDGSYNNVWGHFLYFGGNAIMDVKGEFNFHTGPMTVSGPTTGNDYAIFQCVSIPKSDYMPLKFLNNVYVCRKELYVDRIRHSSQEDGYGSTENRIELAWEASFNKNNEGNGHAVLAAYRQVNFVKDEDECSPQYVPDTPKEVEDQPMTLRFLFEDNFPDLGDFDFNDCVFSITPTVDANNTKKVTVAVRLEATGASKTNGAAIRLVGITDAMLTSKNVTNALPVPDSHLGNYHIPDGDFTISQDPNDNTSLVLLLCKDIHWAMNPVLGDNGSVNGSVQRLFYNTALEGWNNYGQADPKTVTYTFEFKNETDAQKMLDQATYDAFIVEEFNGGTWEVHTVQNDRKGALVLPGNEFQFHRDNYQAYKDTYVNNEETGNYPWAVMVPGTVAYPLEGRNVKTAYPKFESWAQNHTVNTDWYNSPSSGDVHAIP